MSEHTPTPGVVDRLVYWASDHPWQTCFALCAVIMAVGLFDGGY